MTIRDMLDTNIKATGYIYIAGEDFREPSFRKSFDEVEIKKCPNFILDRRIKCITVQPNEFFGFPEMVIELERH